MFDDMFRINLYRSQSFKIYEIQDNSLKEQWRKFGGNSEKVRRKFGESSEKSIYELNELQRKMLRLIRKNNRISAVAMAEAFSVSSRYIEKNIKLLKNQGILIRHGSPKGGYWDIVE